MSKSLETLQGTLPVDVQTSILGSALQEVYVFVINNSQANNLKTSLKKAGLKNISSKTENGLTTVTAQKKQLYPVTSNAKPDYGQTCPNKVNSCKTQTTNNCYGNAKQVGSFYDVAELFKEFTLCGIVNGKCASEEARFTCTIEYF
jgi:hypothetical protein